MHKSKALLAILLIASIGGGGAVYASSFNWDDCSGDNCFVFAQPLVGDPYNPYAPHLDSTSPKVFDIFLPDGTCNLNGKIQSDGSCTQSSIVLNMDNYTRLKNNVAFMAVVNIKDTTAIENVSYCKLAQGIWNGQTVEYQKKLENVTQYVVPIDCMNELGSAYHVPEFGLVASLILLAAVASIVLISWKTGLRLTPRY